MENKQNKNWFQKHCNIAMVLWGMLFCVDVICGICFTSPVRFLYFLLAGFALGMINNIWTQKNDDKFKKSIFKLMDSMSDHIKKLRKENIKLLKEKLEMKKSKRKKK